jgi:hypothetical protein
MHFEFVDSALFASARSVVADFALSGLVHYEVPDSALSDLMHCVVQGCAPSGQVSHIQDHDSDPRTSFPPSLSQSSL